MAIVVTESDCEFLKNTYNPTGKVEMRVKSILIKLATGFIEFDRDVIKEIEINGSNLTKDQNKIILGALANTEFAPADEFLEDVDFKEGIKYIPVLNENKKIPAKYIPATVITDIYPIKSTVNNWTEVVEYLKQEDISPEPEKGDLVIISSTNNAEMYGSYFLLKDIKNIDTNLKEELIKEAFTPLTEPFGHITSLNINGKSYSSPDGIISDLPRFVTNIVGLNSVKISEKESEFGLFTLEVDVEKATDSIPGIVKITDELIEVLEEDPVSASVRLIKKVKDELKNDILNISERVTSLEAVEIKDIPAIAEGETLIDHIADHSFGQYCDAHIYIKETGEEIFTDIKKIKGETPEDKNIVKIPSLKPDKAYADGELILVIKP